MSLIVHKGTVLHGRGLEQFVSYGTMMKLRALSVEVWGFEKLPYAQLAVSWSNGAHGSCVCDSLSALCARLHRINGWPSAVIHSRTLPYCAGSVYIDSLEPVVIHPEDDTPDYAAMRVVRQRAEPIAVRVVRSRGPRP